MNQVNDIHSNSSQNHQTPQVTNIPDQNGYNTINTNQYNPAGIPPPIPSLYPVQSTMNPTINTHLPFMQPHLQQNANLMPGKLPNIPQPMPILSSQNAKPLLHQSGHMYKVGKRQTAPIQDDPSISPCQTLYINNLNDKISIDEMKAVLHSIFKQYGKIKKITMMTSFWRRGQAWVVFSSIDEANAAKVAMQGYLVREKPMRISFSRTDSDIILIEQGKTIPARPTRCKPKAIRLKEEKQREITLENQKRFQQYLDNIHGKKVDSNTNLETKTESDSSKQEEYVNDNPNSEPIKSPRPPPPAPPSNQNWIPEQVANIPEHQRAITPNKTLFITELPENVTQEWVHSLFSRWPGYVESRVIPGRRLAFVEYDFERNATAALKALQGQEVAGTKLCLAYAR